MRSNTCWWRLGVSICLRERAQEEWTKTGERMLLVVAVMPPCALLPNLMLKTPKPMQRYLRGVDTCVGTSSFEETGAL